MATIVPHTPSTAHAPLVLCYWLTPDQSAYHRLGNWLAFEVEEDVLEQIQRSCLTNPIVVLYDDGQVAYGLTP